MFDFYVDCVDEYLQWLKEIQRAIKLYSTPPKWQMMEDPDELGYWIERVD